MSATSSQTADHSDRAKALAVMAVMPLFFSTNIIFGRAAVAETEPFTLAFLRWTLTALVLLPFVAGALKQDLKALREQKFILLAMGFFGMWICGALVYLALKYTTATNGTLIYTSSPVMIILIEWLVRGRKIGLREAVGVVLAFIGVVVIVVKGSWANFMSLQFNAGDLIFVGAALSWALYSVGLKTPKFAQFPTIPLFAVLAMCGAMLLAPFAAVEMIWFEKFPNTFSQWSNIAGIVFFASLLAFSSFQYGVKVLGSSLGGVFLYLLPVYGVTLAVLFLGEQLAAFHGWGILLVLSGVVLATFPARLLQRT